MTFYQPFFYILRPIFIKFDSEDVQGPYHYTAWLWGSWQSTRWRSCFIQGHSWVSDRAFRICFPIWVNSVTNLGVRCLACNHFVKVGAILQFTIPILVSRTWRFSLCSNFIFTIFNVNFWTPANVKRNPLLLPHLRKFEMWKPYSLTRRTEVNEIMRSKYNFRICFISETG